ncbi:hypothetical protein CRYUN_Cryun41cG0000700 [Craigia yunnanensis]
MSATLSSLRLQIRLTWVSRDKEPREVKYGDGKLQTSEVTTFSGMICAVSSNLLDGVIKLNSGHHQLEDQMNSNFLLFGDMGKAPLDASAEHYIQDYADSRSWYAGPDSGGECGVPYETYFPMPTAAKDKPWYSIEQGSVHFTAISTEHDWTEQSEQYEWMKKDMASVDRSKTPWFRV